MKREGKNIRDERQQGHGGDLLPFCLHHNHRYGKANKFSNNPLEKRTTGADRLLKNQATHDIIIMGKRARRLLLCLQEGSKWNYIASMMRTSGWQELRIFCRNQFL
ncbi:MAG: hypothetical protein ACLTXW_07995 [Christensenellales bacterium]